jgi:hypothetical protein
METPVVEPPVQAPPAPDNTVHKSLLHPELRLSRRQKEILGLVGVKLAVTAKQAERNKVAGDRLRAFHATKRKNKEAEEEAKRKSFEAAAKVSVVSQKKRDRVCLKKRDVVPAAPQSESESESSDGEVRRRAKKVSKTAKALEKLDDKISRVAKVAAPSNPYLNAMMMRHF